MNLLDIVIVNYNSTDHLLRCLRSVFDALREIQIKVFVQDNASKDNVDRVALMFPDVVLSKNKKNIGFSRAVNNALEKGGSPYVVLLNPDTYVENGFIGSAIQYMSFVKS